MSCIRLSKIKSLKIIYLKTKIRHSLSYTLDMKILDYFSLVSRDETRRDLVFRVTHLNVCIVKDIDLKKFKV